MKTTFKNQRTGLTVESESPVANGLMAAGFFTMFALVPFLVISFVTMFIVSCNFALRWYSTRDGSIGFLNPGNVLGWLVAAVAVFCVITAVRMLANLVLAIPRIIISSIVMIVNRKSSVFALAATVIVSQIVFSVAAAWTVTYFLFDYAREHFSDITGIFGGNAFWFAVTLLFVLAVLTDTNNDSNS